MFNIKDILNKISPKISLEIKRKQIVLSVIKKYIDTDLNIDNIKITNNTLYINVFGVEKNEIKNNTRSILKELKKENINILNIK